MYQRALVIGSIASVSFGNGFILGQVASLVQSLRRREEGIQLTDGQISIIAGSLMIFNILGMALAAVVSDKVGRKWSFTIFSVPMMANYIVAYFAWDMPSLMLSRLLAGIATGALFALKLCVTSEYVGPKTRAMFLNMISTLAPSIGSAAAHALGIVFHWRTVVLFGILTTISGIILPFFWEESPHWLASKGKFEECEQAFRKLHGSTPNTEAELSLLLTVEKSKLEKAKKTNSMGTLKKLMIACKKKYFWDLMLLGVFISAFIASAGKLAFSTLAVTIIQEMTGSRDNIFGFTMVVDICVILGAAASCLLIKKLSMRSMLFTTGIIGIIVLVSLSACLYFKTNSVYFQWANVSLLSFYFFIVKSGPYPILEALLGEIYPIELKVHFFFFSGIILMSSLALTVLLLQVMVGAMGYHGLFLTNASIMGLSLSYIWLRLPETKGRTLQEIEIYFKTKNFHEIDAVLSNEQVKALI
ncbi:sugar transporter ERD6-like 9 [Maniola jurtina]|uniref:sugar transporter ERD6-like 9 n=1 Tax=Maniola jurtina TaxID=191418 RepID=UPI001E68D9E7|nr:sugar transporter ERD6-like 9 [Maniola jurtina]